MIRSKVFSQAVKDLFPGSDGWVDASERISPADVAKKMLTALADLLGSETKARHFLADAMPAELLALLPKRRRGRPATALQRRKDDALIQVYDWKAAEGKSVRAVARHVHKLGIGRNAESVERKLHRLLKARSDGSRDHRP